MRDIESARVFIAGKTGTGKTYRAWHMYLAHMPRVLILDSTGEWRGMTQADTDTLGECIATITELAPSGQWIVRYSLSDDQFDGLVNWLLPVPNLDDSPSQICGGIAVLVDEVDRHIHTGPPNETARNLYRRSRHAGLTVVSCTQRPGNCSKEVAAQSDQRVALFLKEPRDVDYVADAMRWTPDQVEQWLAWCRRYPHGAVWQDSQTDRLLWLR